MQQIEGRLVLSPTDLTKHLACPHITTLDLQAASGRTAAPELTDDALNLVAGHGLAHERAFLARLRAEGRSIVEIETTYDGPGRRAAEQRTVAAMRSGVDVIYQGTFFDETWGGQADFLLRSDSPSALGPWSYDLADTKLARSLKVPALVQMATYAERLAVLQGAEPQRLIVVTGDGARRPWRLIDVSSFARRARARLSAAVDDRPLTEAVPVQHCAQCRWASACAAGWLAADDLSLVAFMRGDHRLLLRDAGIRTVADLAAADPEQLPPKIGPSSRKRLVGQARLQLGERETGTPSYDLLPADPVHGLGLLRLPEPDPGDLYLDFEGDPYADEGAGREYLAGIGDRAGGFRTLWAHDHDAERRFTEDLVDLLLRRWREYPRMHVYHYAAYEPTAVKRLTGRHGVREAELDQLLRAERFVDLYAVVRQGLRVSKPSYSIKYLEHFYWGQVRSGGDVADAMDSVVAYERWLTERDPDTLRQIEDYNRLDVESTAALHGWLEDRRTDLGFEMGPLPRPGEALRVAEPVSAAELLESALADGLRAAGRPLLAGLVQWHRREGRPRWWDIFRLHDLTDDDLVRDASAIGGLSPPEFEGSDKRSTLWRYTFPAQDTKVREDVLDVDTAAGIGTVFQLDAADGWLVLKVGPNKTPPRPRGFAPGGPPQDTVLRESIAHVGEQALAGQPSTGLRLLERVVPTGAAPRPGETSRQAVVRVGRGLTGGVLAVQGPPGSGKTTVAAELIRALLDDGRRVGVTATSHAVIGNLLRAVGRPGLQKCDPDDHCGQVGVERTSSNDEVAARLASGAVALVGGTAWLWARPQLRAAVDVLVVDEAGQFSLANAVAVAQAAASLVLLGDPQQLTQPTQAQHPDGADASALGHLLAGHDTIPSERGIFLDTSWRMHPAITGFVSDLAYEGRLSAGPGQDRQRVVAGTGQLSGGGLRFVPVEHAGNSAGCDEEVRVVAVLVGELLGTRWADRDGIERRIELGDILVVAPYNNQVGRLRRGLPGAARVGTVDRFQGQEAPVVLYSMASSSAEDAPRGVGFLYDLHRLNVAVSRAQAMAVIVASPRLLDAAVHTPEQLRRVNALCRYVELATTARRRPVPRNPSGRGQTERLNADPPARGQRRGSAAPTAVAVRPDRLRLTGAAPPRPAG